MKKPFVFTISSFLIFTFITLSAIPGFSQDKEIKPIIDPVADKLLKEMGNTLKSAKTLKFHSNITYDSVLPTGQKIQYGGSTQSLLKRPNEAYVQIKGDRNNREIWYSNDQITVLDRNSDFYGRISAPESMDQTMDFLMTEYDFSIPLADIIHSDPYGSFIQNASIGVVVGEGYVGDTQCKHLAFVEKYIDWQIWISEGDKKLPCKLVITYKTVVGSPQFTAVFSDWKLNEKIDDSMFKPKLPKGASKIDFIKIKKGSEEAK